ncbi:MAG: sigma-70 family RNA polymerase sigma factor [Saprospiraceae bacterium]|nr:sigma-70 family RNA polymerase sigma factor [Saprospiraceae bacterium]
MKAFAREKEWAERWSADREGVMSEIYKAGFPWLWAVAFRILQDKELAEDMVQEVMLRIWQLDRLDHIAHSLPAYLHRSVLNKSLNKLREYRRLESEDALVHASVAQDDDRLATEIQDENRILPLLQSLPERCRLVFVLSRFEDRTNQEIAELMHISVKTVENQMTKALRLLRERWKPDDG